MNLTRRFAVLTSLTFATGMPPSVAASSSPHPGRPEIDIGPISVYRSGRAPEPLQFANTQTTPPICPINRFGYEICDPGQPGKPPPNIPARSGADGAGPTATTGTRRTTRADQGIADYCAARRASDQVLPGGLCAPEDGSNGKAGSAR